MSEDIEAQRLSIRAQADRSASETRNQQVLSHFWLFAIVMACGIGTVSLYLNAH